MEGLLVHSDMGYPMGSFANNTEQIYHGGPHNDNCKKRRMEDDGTDLHVVGNANVTNHLPLQSASKSFLPLPKCNRIFHTEEWKPRGTTLFLPLLEDILVNLKNMEQISFNHGTYFVADSGGNYSKSVGGQTVNLWRHSEEEKRLYISRSFLFTHHQDFHDVQEYLQSL